MNMDASRLLSIAHSVVEQPWGLGYTHLNNAESSAPYYRFLHSVVSVFKTKLVVECGTYLGVAAEHMALGNGGTRVVTIDMEARREALEVAERCKNVTFVHRYTTDAASVVCRICSELGCNVGLLFLDSEHDGVTPREEFEVYSYLLDDECLICCDDILDPRMAEFWEWLPGEKMEMNFLHPSQYPGFVEPGFGISIVRRVYDGG